MEPVGFQKAPKDKALTCKVDAQSIKTGASRYKARA